MKTFLVLILVAGVQTLAAQADPRARIIIDLGCSDCHAVAALRVKSKSDVAPDLSAAYIDVPFRYGVPMERFFDQPPSIMRIVLGGRPALTRAQSDALIKLFRTLYTEQLAKSDSAQRRVRAVRAGDPRSLERR